MGFNSGFKVLMNYECTFKLCTNYFKYFRSYKMFRQDEYSGYALTIHFDTEKNYFGYQQ